MCFIVWKYQTPVDASATGAAHSAREEVIIVIEVSFQTPRWVRGVVEAGGTEIVGGTIVIVEAMWISRVVVIVFGTVPVMFIAVPVFFVVAVVIFALIVIVLAV